MLCRLLGGERFFHMQKPARRQRARLARSERGRRCIGRLVSAVATGAACTRSGKNQLSFRVRQSVHAGTGVAPPSTCGRGRGRSSSGFLASPSKCRSASGRGATGRERRCAEWSRCRVHLDQAGAAVGYNPERPLDFGLPDRDDGAARRRSGRRTAEPDEWFAQVVPFTVGLPLPRDVLSVRELACATNRRVGTIRTAVRQGRLCRWVPEQGRCSSIFVCASPAQVMHWRMPPLDEVLCGRPDLPQDPTGWMTASQYASATGTAYLTARSILLSAARQIRYGEARPFRGVTRFWGADLDQAEDRLVAGLRIHVGSPSEHFAQGATGDGQARTGGEKTRPGLGNRDDG